MSASKRKSNNPSGVIKDIPSYIKKKTRGGKQIIDAMLNIAFGRNKKGEPVYEVKERWQALKWLGDHMGESTHVPGDSEGGNVFLIDFSKVRSGSK